MIHQQRSEHIGRAVSTAAIFFGLAFTWVGCKGDETVEIDSESIAIPTEEMLGQDASYLAQLFNQRSNGQPFLTIDLGDERQYKFVIRRLLHAGKTPSDSPRLFQRLREIRAAHRASFAANSRAGATRTSGEVTIASNAGGNGLKCGGFLIATGSNASNQFLTDGAAEMTCDGGADYFYVDETSYQTNETESPLQFLTSTFVEEFNTIKARTSMLHSSVTAAKGFVTMNDSFGMGCDDTTGVCEVTYTKWKHEANTPAKIGNSAGTAASQPATCQLDHPRDSTGDGIVRLCYQRTFTIGVGDCDYAAIGGPLGQPGVAPFTHIAMMELRGGAWVPSTTERWPIPGAPVTSVPNVFLPILGQWDTGTHLVSGQACKTVGFSPADTWATVSLLGTGKWCAGAGTQLPDDNGQLYKNLTANRSSLGLQRTIPFGEDASTTAYIPNLLVDFGPDCLDNLQDAKLIINISATTTCPDPNNPANKTRTATCELAFDVRNSCFAAGTLIRRADGTTAPVEAIQVGEKILANDVGTLLTVTAATRGVEPKPMIRLKDSLGHELLLTAKHPVITTKGAIPAEEITTLSQVETERGVASIVEVERVQYEGPVYNLSVGTPEQLAMVSGLNRTMFAGGIRVGDNEMQFDMERQRASTQTQREPSPAWEIDRTNAMARKQRATKK